jgi:hypothetical protein
MGKQCFYDRMVVCFTGQAQHALKVTCRNRGESINHGGMLTFVRFIGHLRQAP